jgi:alpha-tubulin suppressor-like RCC1 family protein
MHSMHEQSLGDSARLAATHGSRGGGRGRLASLLTFTGLLAMLLGQPSATAASNPPSGEVQAWGNNCCGQLGDGGTDSPRTIPIALGSLPGVIAVAAGSQHSLALTLDGSVWAWGANCSGQLGIGTRSCTTYQAMPLRVEGLTGIVAIAAGQRHSLALDRAGTIWSWGDDCAGQLGIGGSLNIAACDDYPFTDPHPLPSKVPGLSGAVGISAGSGHSLAVKSDGTVWGWGRNSSRQLGYNSRKRATTPRQVSGLTGITAVAAGSAHSLALDVDGTVWAWGDNQFGQLGIGTFGVPPGYYVAAPTKVANLPYARAIAAGALHSLAIDADGAVWAWGANTAGELGDSTLENRPAPVLVHGVSDAVAVAAGEASTVTSNACCHSLALKADGTVWAWGENWSGELGDGSIQDRSTPVQVSSLTGVVAVAAGSDHSLAVAAIPLSAPKPPVKVRTHLNAPGGVILVWDDTSSTETSYSVQRRLGTGTFTTISPSLPPNTTTFTDTSATQLTNYTYRVIAANQAGESASNGLAVTTPAAGYVRAEDSNPAVVYAGNWTLLSDERATGGTVHYAATAHSDTASYTFYATAVTVRMVTGPQMGKADIVLDGSSTTVDLYSPQLQFREAVFSRSGLRLALHTVRVLPHGTRNSASRGFTVALDAFDAN